MGRRKQGRGEHQRFIGFWARLNCENMPVIPAWVVRSNLNDPRRIPYLLVWKDDRHDGKIMEVVRLARCEIPNNEEATDSLAEMRRASVWFRREVARCYPLGRALVTWLSRGRDFADAAALEDKAVAIWPSSADFLKTTAMKWREFADQLSKSNSEMTQFLARATADDLLRKDNAVGVKKYRDDILSYTCRMVKVNRELWQEERSNLAPEVAQALDAESADAAALSADCSLELAISLVKQQAGKPSSN